MNDTASGLLMIATGITFLAFGVFAGSRVHSNMQEISMVCKDSNLENVVTTIYEPTSEYPTFKVTCK